MIWIVLAFVLGFAFGCAFLIYTDLWLEVVVILELFYEKVVHFVRYWRRSMTYKTVTGDDVISVYTSDTYGGQELRICMSMYHKENMMWLQNFRMEHEKEKKLREENQAVKNAWEQYQVVKTEITSSPITVL